MSEPSATAKDKDPKGGLSAAGRKKFSVKKGVTSYSSASDEDKKRWVRWALRFTKTARPLTDDKGQPTRYALMFHAWGEPVPTSTSAVAAVHAKALVRRKQLGMGDSEKASVDDFETELDEMETDVIEQAKTPSGANAPYKIVKQGGKWVVKNNIGDVKASYDGTDAGYQKALAFQRALYASVHGAGDRADKVKFTGKAKNRIKSELERRAEIAAALPKVPEGIGRHDFLSGVDNTCLTCGQILLYPLHGVDPMVNVNDVIPNPVDIPLTTVAEYTGSGCMVALYPDAAGLDGITINGGPDFPVEKREDMHITLCYMPTTPEGADLELLKSVVEDMARTQEPMDGVWGGTALFNPSEGSDGKPVLVALPDIPDLASFREDLVEALGAAGFEVSMSHGYTPHMTIAYDNNGRIKAEGDLHFDAVHLVVGEHFTFPLTGEIDMDPEEAAANVECPDCGKSYFADSKEEIDAHKATHVQKAKLSPKDQAEVDAETQRIKESADTEKAKGVHAFRPARWTHPNGHPRCLTCGQEESISPECNRAPTTAEKQAFQAELKAEFAAARRPRSGRKHRFVGAHHLQGSVLHSAGYFNGCYACGRPGSDPSHSGSVDQAGMGTAPPTAPTSMPTATVASHMDEMTEGPEDAGDTAVDQAFLKMMIPHHEAGVKMLETELEKGEEDTVRELASKMWANQNAEIAQMTAMLTAMPDMGPVESETEILNTLGPGEGRNATQLLRVESREMPQAPAGLVLPTTKAFLTEVHGRTLLTAPASVWEKALTPNKHFLWMQGRFVGAEKANRNGAYWATADLEMGEPTVKHGPLNWLHEDRHVIGSIADAKLVIPGKETAADQLQDPHIVAVAAAWKWLYPDETFVMEEASDQGKLWYSMECVSDTVTCMADSGGCGKTFPYMDMIKASYNVCSHIRERSSTRHFHDPTFLGGAVIVPPVRPGWGEANASVMREAAGLAEQAFDQAGHPDMTASEWELLMASVITYSQIA